MQSGHQAGKRYAHNGEIPVRKQSGQQFMLKMNSSINNKANLQLMILDGKLNGEEF
jgi:hypothetical protein